MTDRDRIRDNLGRFTHNLGDNQSVNSKISQDSIATQPEIPNHIQCYPPVVYIMTYNINLYDRNIKLSTTEGLKSFLKSTEERKQDSQLNISRSNVQSIMDAFFSDARKFSWGVLVNVVLTTAGENLKSILANFTEVKLKHVKKQARTTWGDTAADFNDNVTTTLTTATINPVGEENYRPHLYCCARAKEFVHQIKGSRDNSYFKNLLLKKRDFSLTGDNGSFTMDVPTVLQMLVQGFNPTARVGISNYKLNIKNPSFRILQGISKTWLIPWS